ncbi:hypothetical protein GCM10009102_11840 [Sphingomonas insulae]|uniref:Uncharacterized protein n=1 Tax=Sphingomonas insulae TaxID=424800 RepID=A0ABN1HRB8_9SPHN
MVLPHDVGQLARAQAVGKGGAGNRHVRNGFGLQAGQQVCHGVQIGRAGGSVTPRGAAAKLDTMNNRGTRTETYADHRFRLVMIRTGQDCPAPWAGRADERYQSAVM